MVRKLSRSITEWGKKFLSYIILFSNFAFIYIQSIKSNVGMFIELGLYIVIYENCNSKFICKS